MSDKEFVVAIRKPIYPLIVISAEGLYSAFNIEELAFHCVNGILLDGEKYIKAIDSKGEEFWYVPDQFTIAPSFFCEKWTKKKIIELYNESIHDQEEFEKYSLKSLSAKKVIRIVSDICNILKQ